MNADEELTISCGECGTDTHVPARCFACGSLLVMRSGADGEARLACPREEEAEHPRSYGPTTRDLVPGFGAAVRVRRESLGLSTTKLAKLAGTHQTTVSKIEKEARAPSLLLAVKLATGLEISLDLLLRDAARLAPTGVVSAGGPGAM